jgi:hypothetical protein
MSNAILAKHTNEREFVGSPPEFRTKGLFKLREQAAFDDLTGVLPAGGRDLRSARLVPRPEDKGRRPSHQSEVLTN